MFNRHSNRRLLRTEPLEDRRLLAVANFALADLNPSSTSFLTEVGPSNFSGQVTGWYFGHST